MGTLSCVRSSRRARCFMRRLTARWVRKAEADYRRYLGFVPGDSALAALSAPKGRNREAQGNALGREPIMRSVALKGRDRGPVEPGFRPFRAWAFIPTRFPRALPWAVVLRPFGAGADCGESAV